MKTIVTTILINSVTNWLLSTFCPLVEPKTRIGFSSSWWSGNKYGFCRWRLVLYFKGNPNSIDLYKTIFLYVISVRIVDLLCINNLRNDDKLKQNLKEVGFC